jgi:hypothetical protein
MLLENQSGPLGRSEYSLSAATPDEVVDSIQVPEGRHFVLFLAWDALGVSEDAVVQLARELVRKGLAYLVAWGPDCERVHDLFDSVDVELNSDSNIGPETVIMSTWHDKEPLTEALWFSLNTAYPAPPYNETAVATIAVAIGNAAWGAAIHGYLADLTSLNHAVGA